MQHSRHNSTTTTFMTAQRKSSFNHHSAAHIPTICNRMKPTQQKISNPSRHWDRKPPPQQIIGHHHNHHNNEPRHLPHKHSLQHSRNHQPQPSASIVSLFRWSDGVMGVTTLDSYDILGTGDGIELRSGGVHRWIGGVVLWWLSGVSDVPVMSVLMFRCWRWKCSSDEWGNVRVGYEAIIDLCWRKCSRGVAGHLPYIFIGGTVGWQGETSETWVRRRVTEVNTREGGM